MEASGTGMRIIELVQGVDTTEPELRFQHTTEDGVGICMTLVRLAVWVAAPCDLAHRRYTREGTRAESVG